MKKEEKEEIREELKVLKNQIDAINNYFVEVEKRLRGIKVESAKETPTYICKTSDKKWVGLNSDKEIVTDKYKTKKSLMNSHKLKRSTKEQDGLYKVLE